MGIKNDVLLNSDLEIGGIKYQLIDGLRPEKHGSAIFLYLFGIVVERTNLTKWDPLYEVVYMLEPDEGFLDIDDDHLVCIRPYGFLGENGKIYTINEGL